MIKQPTDVYVELADRLAQDVINVWGANWHAGVCNLGPDFQALLDETFPYWEARRLADNYREFCLTSEKELTQERTTRLAFAKAYKTFCERLEETK